MTSSRNHVALAILLTVCVMGVSGCTLLRLGLFVSEALQGRVNFADGKGQVKAKAATQPCFVETRSDGTFVSCFTEFEADFEVSELTLGHVQNFDPPGFLDPLVVQFPANVSGFSGTFAGATSGALDIQSGLSCVNTAPAEQLCAEAGQQLVILDLPPGTPSDTYELTLNFTVTPPGPITVKPIITGKLTVAGQTFYPVLIPCASSFATVPSITIPVSASLVGIPLPTDGVEPCVRTIDFGQLAAAAIPTLATPVYLGLAVLVATFAVYGLRTRRRAA